MNLLEYYDNITANCFELFVNKNQDYGPTWLLYRLSSINDEIWRKVKRIRTLEENNDQASIPEGRDVEYVGIINYSIMFLIRLNDSGLPASDDIVNDISTMEKIDKQYLYDAYRNNIDTVRDLLSKKNHDYGNAWQSMSIKSLTDQVIIRTFRIRKILENKGKCVASEGITAQLHDIINYSVFALIKMESRRRHNGEITGSKI